MYTRQLIIICFAFLGLIEMITAQDEPQIALALELSSGDCGSPTDCAAGIICFDLYAIPTKPVLLKSYEIWFQLRGGSEEMSTDVLYHTDASCLLYDQPDLPASEATKLIRVAADDGLPDKDQMLEGKTLIHNFCLRADAFTSMQGLTLVAGHDRLGLGSYMTVRSESWSMDARLISDSLDLDKVVPCAQGRVNELAITGVKVEQRAEISWYAPKQLEADYFVVSHAAHGGQFEDLGIVQADSRSRYKFEHERMNVGSNLYRVMAVRVKENIHSNIVSLRLNDFEAFTVFPNPASRDVNISWDTKDAPDVLKITDVLGAVVLEEKVARRQTEQVTLDISQLPGGSYQVQFLMDGIQIAQQQLVKVE